jgi:hypothetical protein
MSDRRQTTATPDPDLAETENALADLNREITAAVVAEITAGGLSPELASIVDARDTIRKRLGGFSALLFKG